MLRQHADHFKIFLSMPYDSREGEFFRKLNILDTTTIFPFLLGLYQILSEEKNVKIVAQIWGNTPNPSKRGLLR